MTFQRSQPVSGRVGSGPQAQLQSLPLDRQMTSRLQDGDPNGQGRVVLGGGQERLTDGAGWRGVHCSDQRESGRAPRGCVGAGQGRGCVWVPQRMTLPRGMSRRRSFLLLLRILRALRVPCPGLVFLPCSHNSCAHLMASCLVQVCKGQEESCFIGLNFIFALLSTVLSQTNEFFQIIFFRSFLLLYAFAKPVAG